MQATEIVFIPGPGSEDYVWTEIADAGHTNVQFIDKEAAVSHVGFGETAPTVGFPIQLFSQTGAPIVRIEGANTKVWALLIGENGLKVMRGDGQLTQTAH